MARSRSTGQAWAVIIALVLVAGGCMQVKAWLFPPEPVAVPDLTGKTLTEAYARADELGLRLSEDGLLDPFCVVRSKCTVVRVSPSPRTTVPPESTVTVQFLTAESAAWYRRHHRMPKVVGWSDERASELFQPVSNAVTTDYKQTGAVPVGKDRVIRQSPKPGAALRPGQKIRIVIGYNVDVDSAGSGSGRMRLGDGDDGRRRRPSFCSRSRWC